MNKKASNDYADIEYNTDDRILFIRFKAKAIDEPQAEIIVNSSVSITGNEVHCNIVDMRKALLITSKARKYFAGQNRDTVNALAILASSKIHATFANFYLKFDKPNVETRLFSDEENAIKWLRSML